MISSPWLAQATFSPDPLQSAWVRMVCALAVGGDRGVVAQSLQPFAGQPWRRCKERKGAKEKKL